MAANFETQGELHSIGETTSYGQNGFTKREFVIRLTGEGQNPAYPNYVAFELVKDKCALLDSAQLGEEVKVTFDLRGRLWQAPGKGEKCFNSLQAWRVDKVGMDNEQAPPANFEDYGNFNISDDDVPF